MRLIFRTISLPLIGSGDALLVADVGEPGEAVKYRAAIYGTSEKHKRRLLAAMAHALATMSRGGAPAFDPTVRPDVVPRLVP